LQMVEGRQGIRFEKGVKCVGQSVAPNVDHPFRTVVLAILRPLTVETYITPRCDVGW